MKILKTKFKDLLIIKKDLFKDKRGELSINYNKKIIKKNFLYEYAATSKKNVFRGFHYQTKFKQAKLITVLKGKILDCVIDLRKNSKTFKKIFKIILSDKNKKSIYIPEGFAHGYYVYENDTVVNCKQNNYFKPKYEKVIFWNDENYTFNWKFKKPILSNKDKRIKNN